MSVLMFRNFEQNQNTIADALKENARLYKLNFNKNVHLNRLCLRVVIRAVLYLVIELMAQKPFYDDIIDKFASLKDRSIDLIYKNKLCKYVIKYKLVNVCLSTRTIPSSSPFFQTVSRHCSH